MDYQTIKLIISDEIAENMEERGIREDDLRAVIEYAETAGKKLYLDDEPHFLSRKRIGNFSAYVEYVMRDEEIELIDAYSHIVTFGDEQ